MTSKPSIKLTYTTCDRYIKRASFKTLKGARAFAHNWVGAHPEQGIGYAISGDGVGKMMWSDTTFDELFPSVEATAAAKATPLTKAQEVTPLIREAIDTIILHGAGSSCTKAAAANDMGMFWFGGDTLMKALGLSVQGAGGVIHAMDHRALASKSIEKTGPKGGSTIAWCLTERALEFATVLVG